MEIVGMDGWYKAENDRQEELCIIDQQWMELTGGAKTTAYTGRGYQLLGLQIDMMIMI